MLKTFSATAINPIRSENPDSSVNLQYVAAVEQPFLSATAAHRMTSNHRDADFDCFSSDITYADNAGTSTGVVSYRRET